jgi:hypothetical protein
LIDPVEKMIDQSNFFLSSLQKWHRRSWGAFALLVPR